MQVKVCNFRSNSFGSDFKESSTETGFAVITHHGIDQGLIREVQQAWRLFYLNSPEYKQKFMNPEDPNMGYMGYKKEKAVGSKIADLKEFYHWKPGKQLPTEVTALTQHMFGQLEDISSVLLSVLDSDNNTGFSFRKSCAESDNTILRTLYYPAMDFSKEQGAIRAAAHEDINFITLLVAASAPGLQVLDKKGNWHNVPHEENSIVVNMGDMLQLATNGYYGSTTHRVINPDNNNADRVSMPLFVHPHSNTILAPGKTAQQYLDERLDQIYGRVK